MISGPDLLSMATVVRAWISFMLMVSKATLAPLCFSNSATCFLRAASWAGTKFTHCRYVSRVPCNWAGAWPALAGRTPPSMAIPVARPATLKNARRFRDWAATLPLNMYWPAMAYPFHARTPRWLFMRRAVGWQKNIRLSTLFDACKCHGRARSGDVCVRVHAVMGGSAEELWAAQRISPVACTRLRLVEDLLEAGVDVWQLLCPQPRGAQPEAFHGGRENPPLRYDLLSIAVCLSTIDDHPPELWIHEPYLAHTCIPVDQALLVQVVATIGW